MCHQTRPSTQHNTRLRLRPVNMRTRRTLDSLSLSTSFVLPSDGVNYRLLSDVLGKIEWKFKYFVTDPRRRSRSIKRQANVTYPLVSLLMCFVWPQVFRNVMLEWCVADCRSVLSHCSQIIRIYHQQWIWLLLFCVNIYTKYTTFAVKNMTPSEYIQNFVKCVKLLWIEAA